ncbi:MAG: hypothetical protein H0X30_10145 [Anaerolineae bacterium]|nr:hypothetical protein [Anaerolineae bacterium]
MRAIAIITLLLILGMAYFLRLANGLFSDDPLLTALLHGDDSLNAKYLSIDFQQYISQHCPDGRASACIQSLVSPDWGKPVSVKFGIGSGSAKSELYYSGWSNNQSIVIVLLFDEENGRQVYTGWRGFVPSEGENRDAELLGGQRHDNEFPPVKN